MNRYQVDFFLAGERHFSVTIDARDETIALLRAKDHIDFVLKGRDWTISKYHSVQIKAINFNVVEHENY